MTAREPSDRAVAVERLISGRRSCRAYLREPVPEETIDQLLTLAQRAASWCNTQPWEVIVTTGEGTERFREALFAHVSRAGAVRGSDIAMPPDYTGVHRERRRESGWQLYEALGIARGDRAASAEQARENFRLFGAPHCAIITVDADLGPYGVLDVGSYVATFLLAAEGLGLGAIPQAALASFGPFIRDHFAIPADRSIVLGISFGWPNRVHPANTFRTTRASMGEVARVVAD